MSSIDGKYKGEDLRNLDISLLKKNANKKKQVVANTVDEDSPYRFKDEKLKNIFINTPKARVSVPAKSDVEYQNFTPAMNLFVADVATTIGTGDLNFDFVITSGTEGDHAKNSKHYDGRAVDVRISKNFRGNEEGVNTPWDDPMYLFFYEGKGKDLLAKHNMYLNDNLRHGDAPHLHIEEGSKKKNTGAKTQGDFTSTGAAANPDLIGSTDISNNMIEGGGVVTNALTDVSNEEAKQKALDKLAKENEALLALQAKQKQRQQVIESFEDYSKSAIVAPKKQQPTLPSNTAYRPNALIKTPFRTLEQAVGLPEFENGGETDPPTAEQLAAYKKSQTDLKKYKNDPNFKQSNIIKPGDKGWEDRYDELGLVSVVEFRGKKDNHGIISSPVIWQYPNPNEKEGSPKEKPRGKVQRNKDYSDLDIGDNADNKKIVEDYTKEFVEQGKGKARLAEKDGNHYYLDTDDNREFFTKNNYKKEGNLWIVEKALSAKEKPKTTTAVQDWQAKGYRKVYNSSRDGDPFDYYFKDPKTGIEQRITNEVFVDATNDPEAILKEKIVLENGGETDPPTKKVKVRLPSGKIVEMDPKSREYVEMQDALYNTANQSSDAALLDDLPGTHLSKNLNEVQISARPTEADKYPYWDHLSTEEKQELLHPSERVDLGSHARYIRDKATYGYGIKSKPDWNVKDALIVPSIMSESTQMVGRTLQAPQALAVEAYEAYKGNPYNFADANPFGYSDKSTMRAPSDIMGSWGKVLNEETGQMENTWLGTTADMVLDPTNLVGAGLFGKGVKGANALSKFVTPTEKLAKSVLMSPNTQKALASNIDKVKKALPSFSKKTNNGAVTKLEKNKVGKWQPIKENVTEATLTPKKNTLNIKSTMKGSPLEKQLNKQGQINSNNLQNYINKKDVSKADKFIMNKVLKDKFPDTKNIDYAEFKQAVSDELVPLDIKHTTEYANYGHDKIGFSDKKQLGYREQDLSRQTRKLEEARETLIKQKEALTKGETIETPYGNIIKGTQQHDIYVNAQKMAQRAKDDVYHYGKNPSNPNFKPDVLEALKKEEKVMTDAVDAMAQNFNREGNQDFYLKNLEDAVKNSDKKVKDLTSEVDDMSKQPFIKHATTLKFSNEGRFGRGDASHFSDSPVGHSRIMVSEAEPDVFHIVENQSDYFQKSQPSISSKNLGHAEKQYNTRLKEFEDLKNAKKEHMDWEWSDKTTPEPKAVTKNEWQLAEKSVEDTKRILDTAKGDLANPQQKEFLGKNYVERQLQENVAYAVENGQTKVRIPTPETVSKVQGYPKVGGDGQLQYPGLPAPSGSKPIDSKFSFDNFTPEHQTILKKYTKSPKQIKKTFGVETRNVTDPQGNTWFEFDIPESYMNKEAEIKALEDGGTITHSKKDLSQLFPMIRPMSNIL